MLSELHKDYLDYINKTIEITKEKEKELRQVDCKDEADMEKIKVNIYEIFQTLYYATEKKIKKNKELEPSFDEKNGFDKEYLLVFEKIPNNWKDNYQKAKDRELAKECLIEETKLEIVQELRELFLANL